MRILTPIQDEDVTPIQDDIPTEATIPIATAKEDRPLDQEDDHTSIISSSQEKHCFLTFTSPSYCQEEVASHGEPEHIRDMPELLAQMPGTMPKVMPATSAMLTPQATPKTMPKLSPKRPVSSTLSLQG